MFNMVLFGPPGSGKGTQSAKVAEKYGLAHISTGDIFRREISEKTELGLKMKNLIENGQLVPDDFLIEILENAMAKYKNVNGFVFDGFPRTIRQAEDFDLLMKKNDDSVSLVVALDVNDEEIISRLLKRAIEEGRIDDTEEVIKNRLDVYNNQTSPLIELYKKQNKFESVYGIGSIEEIFDKICKVVDEVIRIEI